MQKVQVLYWRFFKDMPEEYMGYTVKEWHRFFENTPAQDISDALDRHINESEFPPGIAELKTQLKVVYDDRHRKKLAEQKELPPPNNPISDEEREQLMAEMRRKLSGIYGS